jgi:hypothetical protein
MSVKLNLDAINKEFAGIKLVWYVAIYTDGAANVFSGNNRRQVLQSVNTKHLSELIKIKPLQGRSIRETLMCIYYDHGFCDYKKPDTGERDEEAVTQMRMEERIESAERQIQKLDRAIWEVIKDKGSDGLAWEQDFLNATRRIEELESRMSGVCEWQQIQEGKAMEIRNIDDERFEKLEILSLKADERIEALEKQHVDLTPQHHVADAVRKMDEMQNRIAALEVAGASLKLYLHSNGLWRRSSD